MLRQASVTAAAAIVAAGLLAIICGPARADWDAVTLSDSVLAFGPVSTGTTNSIAVTITNHLDVPVEVTGAAFERAVFWTDLAPVGLPAHGSQGFHVFFSSIQNLDYTDFLRIELAVEPQDGVASPISRPLVARVSAEAEYPDTYYASTHNKWAEELKDALTDLIDGHTALGYNTARDSMYGSIDNVGGWVECVYTGRKAYFNTRAGATANGFNCEHTWPQSFSNDAEPMRSDIFHLYATDETANTMRGNLDFGMVVTPSWQVGGSKLGTDAQGQQIFEPRDAHKGNVARTIFYYVIRYNGAYNQWVNATKLETWLRVWHVSDPADSAERARNQHIWRLQHNRNPFIDHPELVDRISSFFGTATHQAAPEIAVAPASASLGTVGFDTTATYFLGIANSGDDTLHVTSITSLDASFAVGASSLALPPASYAYVAVTYASGGTALVDSTRIIIASDDSDESSIEVLLSVEVGATAGVPGAPGRDAVGALRLYVNAPNPFRTSTVITFDLDRDTPVDLAVYNIRGQIVTRILRNQLLPRGRHGFTFSSEALPAGIYYCRLAADGRVRTQSMLRLGQAE